MQFILSLLTVFTFATYLSSCSADAEDDLRAKSQPNILLIIADDLGKDALSGFTEGTVKANTPNLDAIRNDGLTFTNLWVNPTCTPTRAAIITGKYGYRTGVKGVGDILDQSDVILQKYISDNTDEAYATAIVGKWHLSGNNNTVNPESFGMDYYAGLIRGAVDNYYQWQLTESGVSNLETSYVTEKLTDLSIDWVNEQTKPWFLWLAYNAPHTPFHVPPGDTHSQGNLPEYTNGLDPIPYYMAAIESMDYHIGRLLESMPEKDRENTVIIFLGDNGAPNQVAQEPYGSGKVKNTLYQGGVNTPLYISGPGVTRSGTDDNLITATDLFATIAGIAGVATEDIYDSQSFKSLLSQTTTLRDYQYAEFNDDVTDQWTIRNDTYKLIVIDGGGEEMYNLVDDPYELSDLLKGQLSAEETSAKSALELELNNIRQ